MERLSLPGESCRRRRSCSLRRCRTQRLRRSERARHQAGALVAGLVAFRRYRVCFAPSRRHRTTTTSCSLKRCCTVTRGSTGPAPISTRCRYGGRYYVIEAPLPALLLLPFVPIFGAQTNQTLLAAVLAAVAIGAAWELGERLGLKRASIAWLCAFLLAGTDLLWCAMLGDVWFIAHVSAVCFTMLALVELTGKRRGWLVALFAVCALESRFHDDRRASGLRIHARDSPRQSRCRGARCARSVRCWCRSSCSGFSYNEARWGTWTDIGYTHVVPSRSGRHADRIAVSPRVSPVSALVVLRAGADAAAGLSGIAAGVLGGGAHLDVAGSRASRSRA